ncbi:P2Y purinoceptor 14-like [Myxocyprinus asiaticus]|uniref:P2Y purinoceptor 14-like n=1 Tax=Myxocyprinus asiaticus TaxID=70543 RepID=UPI00222216BC|nr:P2Y purinoceptor 14-like [Myxocyprinus asiaticus]
MESPVPSTSFITSPNDLIKPNTTNITQAFCDFSKIPANPFFIFAYSLVCIVSLVLNCITIRVYFCTNHQVQSSFTVYLKNLATADFLICLSLPVRIATYANFSVIMYNIYCSFVIAAFYVNMYASILFMDFIAANRYLKIVRPLETHALQTVHTARYISVAAWFLLLSLSSIYIILFLQTSWGNSRRPEGISCESLHSPQFAMAYKIINSCIFVFFIFLLISLILLYLRTLQKLREAQMSTQVTSNSHKIEKSRRNMLVLLVIFCVCFVPYHLMRLTYTFISPLLDDCTTAQVFFILKEVTVLMSVLNACLDPLIYFLFCKAFRAQFSFMKKRHQPDSERRQNGR